MQNVASLQFSNEAEGQQPPAKYQTLRSVLDFSLVDFETGQD